MKRYVPLTVAEMARINDSLRVMELSLLWYGTRDHSLERLSQFVSQEGKGALQALMGLLQGRIEAGSRSALQVSAWLRMARRLAFQFFGIYPGKIWVAETLLLAILAACTDFLDRTSCSDGPPTDDELATLKRRIACLHADASGIVPAGQLRSSLRFFGCESYGKFAQAIEGKNPEKIEGAA